MIVVALLTALGLGSVITVLAQAVLAHYAANRERSFNERKAAYVGLLEAYHRAAIEGTDEASKNFAYWQMRCELVAPKPVRDAIVEIINTNDRRSAREQAHEDLKSALRTDLGVAR